MKIRLGDVVDSQAAIEQILALKLPPKVGYRVGKACRRIRQEIAEWERLRLPLLKEHGAEDPKRPGWFSIASENQPRFNEAMDALNAVEVELDGVEPIPVEELGDTEISVAALAALEWLFMENGTAQQEPTKIPPASAES